MNKYKMISSGKIEPTIKPIEVKQIIDFQQQENKEIKFEEVFVLQNGVYTINEEYVISFNQSREIHRVRNFSNGEIAEIIPSRDHTCNLSLSIHSTKFFIPHNVTYHMRCRVYGVEFLVLNFNISIGDVNMAEINMVGLIR